MRAVLALAVSALLGGAPLQCAGEPDEPALRRYETPPEALWDLAERFSAAGDVAGRRRTLEFLVERYPSSRFAHRAREELAGR